MYKPNFCAECGDKITREQWTWRDSRRFCDDCAPRLENNNKIWQIPLLAVAIFSFGFIADRYFQPARNPVAISNNQLAAVKNDAVASKQQIPNAVNSPVPKPSIQNVAATTPPPKAPSSAPLAANQMQATEAVYFCGARTQKGTPCSRRVRGGGRCWQHVGKPAIIPAEKLLISQ